MNFPSYPPANRNRVRSCTSRARRSSIPCIGGQDCNHIITEIYDTAGCLHRGDCPCRDRLSISPLSILLRGHCAIPRRNLSPDDLQKSSTRRPYVTTSSSLILPALIPFSCCRQILTSWPPVWQCIRLVTFL